MAEMRQKKKPDGGGRRMCMRMRKRMREQVYGAEVGVCGQGEERGMRKRMREVEGGKEEEGEM